MTVRTTVVVVGAGPAGLGTAACLARAGIEHVLLEAAPNVAASWRRHYDRLHLHTPKRISALPFVPYPRAAPRYPSRDDVIDYLERYVATMGLRPRLGEPVTAIAAAEHDAGDPGGDRWTVETARAPLPLPPRRDRDGSRPRPPAAGMARPRPVPGRGSPQRAYRNGAAWRGRRVLVIGIGNSGGEIAVDLLEHGATPVVSVRGPVNVIPREVFGIPILAVGAVLRALPSWLGDLLGRPLIRLRLGNVEALGLRRLPYGALTQVDKHGRVPLIDSGTIAHIRAGRIAFRGGVERFTADGVRFDDGREEPFDAVVAATGYTAGLSDTLGALATCVGRRASGRTAPSCRARACTSAASGSRRAGC